MVSSIALRLHQEIKIYKNQEVLWLSLTFIVGLSKICYRVLEKEDRNSFGDFQ
jgi:hypothetical protein